MLFSTNTMIAVDRLGLMEGVKLLFDSGFPALDLTLYKNNEYIFESGYKTTAKELMRLAESRGGVFNQAHAPFGGGYDNYVTNLIPTFPRVFEFAGLLGVKQLIVHPLVKYRHYGHEREHFDMNMEFYSSLVPYSKDTGVKIAIENMWGRHPVTGRICDSVCSDPDELSRYYDALDMPDVFTVCLDLGHVAITGREPERAISAVGHRLGAIHAHDVDYMTDTHTLPGLGGINWTEVISALAAVGYSGEFTLEIDNFAKNFDDEYLPVAFKFAADTARYLTQKLKKCKQK